MTLKGDNENCKKHYKGQRIDAETATRSNINFSRLRSRFSFLFCSIIDETFQAISLSLTFQYAVCFAGLS